MSTHIGNVHPNVLELASPAASPGRAAIHAVHQTDNVGHVRYRGTNVGPAHSTVEEVVCYEMQAAALPVGHLRRQLAEGSWEGQWVGNWAGHCTTPTSLTVSGVSRPVLLQGTLPHWQGDLPT